MPVRVLLSLVLCSVLGCGSNSRAPVEDRTAQSPYGTYTVQRGDTLYSIAFRSGMDYRKVAAANGIVAPYTIYPGQNILLHEAVPAGQADVAPAVTGSRPVLPPTPVPTAVPAPVRAYGSSTAHTPAPEPVAREAVIAEPPIAIADRPAVSAPVSAPIPTQVPAPVPVPVPAPTPTPTQVPAPEVVRPVPETSKPPAAGGDKVETWLWPTAGSVTRGYSESVHKGIDIGGTRGDPIVAVAAGKVVYGGTGIVGFGELLIVKHNEEYLSAYGHNDRLLVAEGQTVTAGQIIAEKGSSGTDSVKLHFEIRKEGKPIDPQRVLPSR